jgi:hypothetical protein
VDDEDVEAKLPAPGTARPSDVVTLGEPDGAVVEKVELVVVKVIEGAAVEVSLAVQLRATPCFMMMTSAFTLMLELKVPDVPAELGVRVRVPEEDERLSHWGSTLVEMFPPEALTVI